MAAMWNWVTSIDWWTLFLWITVTVFVGVGLVGTVIPALPGIPMIFIGAWLAAWIGDYENIGWVALTFLGVLTVIGFAVDWVAQSMGAQKAGASRYGMAGSLVGTVVGLFMGVVGILFMPLVGAFIGEYIAKRDLRVAGNVGWATWIGMLAGAALKVAIAFTMIGIMTVCLWV